MLTLVALCALGVSGTPAADVRQLDAEFARLEPYPIDSPKSHLRETLEGYQNLADDNPSPRAEAGVGNCLSLFGRYKEAVEAFRRAGPAFAARLAEAALYEDVASVINKQTSKLAVRQLRHVPDGKLWVALLSGPNVRDGWVEDTAESSQVVVYRRDEASKRLTQIGKPQQLEEYYAGEFCTLYLSRLSQKEMEWHPFVFYESTGDCVPVYVRIYSLIPTGPKPIQTFKSVGGSTVRGPSATRGMLVTSEPIKVTQWSDVYEWTVNGFQLANRRNPA